MDSKSRFILALENKIPDRLPVTTHHLMPTFLRDTMEGMNEQEFFEHFGLDAINWVNEHTFSPGTGEFFDPQHTKPGFLEARRIISDNWRVEITDIPHPKYKTQRFSIITPVKTLSMVLQSDAYTTWVTEKLIKEKSDIEVIAKYQTFPQCDVEAVNKIALAYGNRGLIRGHIAVFDGYGQPGCWQDAACLYGIENLIMATFEDPQWVHQLLGILQERKILYVRSLKGAKFDLLELGGGDASTTVISPAIFNEFVAPYDEKLIKLAHEAGQRIAYHTCGGMMPVLEDIANMNPDAMETFTPPGMGADADLAEAKKRIGDKVCMIGGFDQLHFFTDCSPDDTRREVRRCFEAAGNGGGFILSPSDHFFEADPELIKAYAEEAISCVY